MIFIVISILTWGFANWYFDRQSMRGKSGIKIDIKIEGDILANQDIALITGGIERLSGYSLAFPPDFQA
jgi:hypothetical protein